MTDFSLANFTDTNVGIPTECMSTLDNTVEYNMNCMINHICPNLPSHFIKIGIILLIVMMIVMLFQIIMNRTKLIKITDEQKIYLHAWLDARLIVVCFAFILLMIINMGGML